MKSIKPLVLGVWMALNVSPSWAQSQPAAVPSILDSGRVIRQKPADQKPVKPKPVEAEPNPAVEILQTRSPESVSQSRDRIENERIVQQRTAVEPPSPATPNIRETRRVKPPQPVSQAMPAAPAESVFASPVAAPGVATPIVAAPVAAAPVAPAPAPAPTPAAAAPVVAMPSIVPQASGNTKLRRAPEAVKEDSRSVPLREADALNVPDVNIPLIGFREKYAVPEEAAPAPSPVVEAAPVPVAVPEQPQDTSVATSEPTTQSTTVLSTESRTEPDASVAEAPQPPVEIKAETPAAVYTAVKPASNILEMFALARGNSPTFRAAEALRDANLTESTIAKLAFLPTGSLGLTQSELEDSTRKVFRVGVPLFSLAVLAKFREADPLEIQAYANYRVQENALANEVFRVTSNLLRASEQERLNQANIDTLQQQVRFAEQAYREGQGTITDLRDTQVRLNQALANRIAAVSQRVSAEQEYRNLVGEPPSRQALQMSAGFKDIQIDTYEAYLQRATQGNPSYIAATQALKISELSILRSKGGVAPTVGLSAVASERNGRRTENVGIAVSIPFGVQDYLAVSVAKDKHRAQTETYRGIEQNLRLMIQQLQSLSASGRIEVAVRTDAISSAELSVQANQKSYLGGVRTQIEVLNSIQTLFDTQLQQINARLTLAQNVLKLELESGSEPVDALMKVQTLLF